LYTGIQRHEKQAADLMHASFGRVLGAHLIPIRDAVTGELRLPTTFQEVQPILPAIARPAFLATIGDVIDKMAKGMDGEQAAPPDIREVDDAPPAEIDTGDTGLEILDRPIDISRMSEVERRQVLAVAGVEIVDQRKPASPEEDVRIDERGAHPVPIPRSSFVLDD